jgi:hypothetical protein
MPRMAGRRGVPSLVAVGRAVRDLERGDGRVDVVARAGFEPHGVSVGLNEDESSVATMSGLAT